MDTDQFDKFRPVGRGIIGAAKIALPAPSLEQRAGVRFLLRRNFRRGAALLRSFVLACAALLLLSLAQPAPAAELAASQAQPAPNLNLSPAQQQKLGALESTSRAQASQLTEQIKQLRGKLADLYKAYNLDPNDAKRLNSQLNSVQQQLLDLRLSEQVQLRSILTADQFAQLQAAIAQPSGWKGHHGRDHARGRHT